MNTLQKNIVKIISKNDIYSKSYLYLRINNKKDFEKLVDLCYKNEIKWAYELHNFNELINRSSGCCIGLRHPDESLCLFQCSNQSADRFNSITLFSLLKLAEELE